MTPETAPGRASPMTPETTRARPRTPEPTPGRPCPIRGALAALLLACAPAPLAAPEPAPRLAAADDPVPAPVPGVMPDATGPAGHVPRNMPDAPGPAGHVPADMSDAPPRPDPRAAETRSVFPGINAAYRDPKATRRWARSFERDGREVHDRRAQIVQALALRPGMAVADVGAGSGLFTLAFAEAVGPTGRVYAVDLIPHFLAHIRAKAEKAGVTHVTLVQATDRSAELPPASVDVVFMSDAYHHLEFPQHVLASLLRALRPGGSLWLIDFNRGPDSDEWLRRHVRAGKAEVVQELAQAGFDVVAEPALLTENYVLQLRPRPTP